MSSRPRSISRRGWLVGVTGAATATSGCLNPIRRAIERDAPRRLSLEIKTPPSDDHLFSLSIANNLAENLERAGIQVDVAPTRHVNLLRDVLINLDFDLYIWSHPGHTDPDYLRPFLHSRFAEEPGWQNPFSFSHLMIDELLEDQLRDGMNRDDQLVELQQHIANESPFVPIVFEDEQRLYRNDRLNYREQRVASDNPLWVYQLSPAAVNDEDDVDEERTFRLGTTDGRITHNLNPITVEYRGPPMDPTGLLYEPLLEQGPDGLVPWLAESYEWVSPTGARAPTIQVTLRPDLQWHDGEPLTAHDVAFTFRFLNDTSMKEDEDPTIPAPRFRGRSTLFDTAEAISNRVVRIQFVGTSRRLAMRLLTVPILPEHIWSGLTGLTEVAGIPVSDVTTDALVDDNLEPVGSGPYRVTDVNPDRSVTLERAEEHFLWDPENGVDQIASVGRPAIKSLVFDVRPSVSNMISALAEGDLDASASDVGRVARGEATEDYDTIDYVEWSTTRLFHVGMNLRAAPFTIHGFRDTLAQMIDRAYIAEEIFRGNARPTISPLSDEERVPDELRWDREDAPFLGEVGTGEINEEAVRERFREAGFQYAEDGSLLAR